jgi:hypothetical protein
LIFTRDFAAAPDLTPAMFVIAAADANIRG